MTDTTSPPDRRAAIDEALESVLDVADESCFAPARRAIDGREDRWYGRLLLRSFEATSEAPTAGPAVPAAAAIEFLRAYGGLRAELVAAVHEGGSGETRVGLSSALLAGDYLFASALGALGDLDGGPPLSCIDTFTAVSQTIVEALHAAATASTDPRVDRPWIVDHSAGVLGECAAVIGATLGEGRVVHRTSFAAIGRGLATTRELGLDDWDLAPFRTRSVVSGAGQVRTRRARRREEVDQALSHLPTGVDANPLLAFAERTVDD